MCDYSLEHVASRPAAVADRLTVVTFANTISRGFAGLDDVNCAVCLRPGTEIAFDQPAVYEHPVTWMQVTCRRGSPASGSSTATCRAPTTTRWNSRTARSCC